MAKKSKMIQEKAKKDVWYYRKVYTKRS
jgi:hypothetical protein